MNQIKINSVSIGDSNPCFTIAEAGANHDGEVQKALKLIDSAIEAKADSIKFQNFKASRLVTKTAPKYWNDGISEENQFDVFKKLDILSEDNWREIFEYAKKKNIKLKFNQTNIEGEIVSLIQESNKKFDGLIINAAGYTHTSVAIRDALVILKKPSIELHISNIYKREEFRHKSMISDVVTGIICGLGTNGYILAINAMHELLKNGNR